MVGAGGRKVGRIEAIELNYGNMSSTALERIINEAPIAPDSTPKLALSIRVRERGSLIAR